MLKMHFLNVGKGNCTVIKFPSGKLALVDIDNSKICEDDEVLQCPIDFLDREYPKEAIFRFVLTHPDLDHMSGLHELSKKRKIYNFWDTEHDKTVELDKVHLGGYDKNDWIAYQHLRQQDSEPKVFRLLQNSASQKYWDEDRITVLGPSSRMIKHAASTGEHNHVSYVLRIEHEGIRILLGGDATKESWKDILRFHGKGALKADIFLAPHHGSSHNIEKDVFQHINPAYVIVSDHRGHSYDYAYYNSLASKQVYSTKYFGTITVEISADKKTIYPEKNG